jgi:thioredoxin 1
MTKTTLIIAALSFYISIHSLLGFASEPRRMDFLMTAKPKTKLVLFSANWCLPCKMINKWMQEDKVIKKLISQYEIEYYDFDLDKAMKKKYDVKKIPTLIVVRDGVEKARKIGISSGKKGLESFLETYK